MLAAVHRHFSATVTERFPLFTTKTDGRELWNTFLAGLPPELQQQHNCHSCRHFVERFGGLVVIDQQGRTESAVWGGAPGPYAGAFEAVKRAVEAAPVSGVHVTDLRIWGTPQNRATNNPEGVWRHMSVAPPKYLVYDGRVKTAHERAAELVQDFAMIRTALADYPADVVEDALRLVRAGALFRGDKVEDRLAWLVGLHGARAAAAGRAHRDNVVWAAVAAAPVGWAHVRSGVVGTLLDDVKAGLPAADIRAKYNAKLSPLQYRRPTKEVDAGTVKRAEELVAKLGTSGAFKRRYARLDDLRPRWIPRSVERQAPEGLGMFAELLDHKKRPDLAIVAPPMDLERFLAEVLPGAHRIEAQAPLHGPYVAFVTAEDPEAPPVLQWDHEEHRNPVSMYVYASGSHSRDFNLVANSWVPVLAVTDMPWQWTPGFKGNLADGVAFVLEHCRDLKTGSGLGLFPEFLRAEYHGVRAAVEAYQRRHDPEYRAEGVGGLVLTPSTKYTLRFKVTDVHGGTVEHTVDRWR
jgi:hypothetical protein